MRVLILSLELLKTGRGLPLSQDIEDSHVTLTPVNPDGQQESSSASSQFVTSMLNPTSDAATIITISHAPIPPTPIPSEVLQNLPTFDSVFRFNDRLKSLEARFSEYRQTNPFAEAVSNIPDRLRDSYQRENDEFLQTIDENMKRIIKEQVKGQVKEQVSRILPRIEQSVNAQLEAEVLTREDAMMSLTRMNDPPLDQTGGLRDEEKHPEWFSQSKKPPTPDHDWNKTLPAV
nr:hypothetical protein [Tanacetum cinerariifolium]